MLDDGEWRGAALNLDASAGRVVGGDSLDETRRDLLTASRVQPVDWVLVLRRITAANQPLDLVREGTP